MLKNCEHCHKLFEPYRVTQRFCSLLCTSRAKRERLRDQDNAARRARYAAKRGSVPRACDKIDKTAQPIEIAVELPNVALPDGVKTELTT